MGNPEQDDKEIAYYDDLLKKHFPITISPLFPHVPDNECVEIEWKTPDGVARGIYAHTKRETEMVLRGMFAVVQSLHYIPPTEVNNIGCA